jgi:hypothetical protein
MRCPKRATRAWPTPGRRSNRDRCETTSRPARVGAGTARWSSSPRSAPRNTRAASIPSFRRGSRERPTKGRRMSAPNACDRGPVVLVDVLAATLLKKLPGTVVRMVVADDQFPVRERLPQDRRHPLVKERTSVQVRQADRHQGDHASPTRRSSHEPPLSSTMSSTRAAMRRLG